jgi:hypothetical protein
MVVKRLGLFVLKGLLFSARQVVIGDVIPEDECKTAKEQETGVGSERFVPEEFTDHPKAVGRDPEAYRDIVVHLFPVGACDPGDQYGEGNGGDDHHNTEQLPFHAPADVFAQPEKNVKVLKLADSFKHGLK